MKKKAALGVNIALWGGWLIVMFVLTGCGALTGIKKVEWGEFKMEMVSGADFHFGANAIDEVRDVKGINSSRLTDRR